MSKDNVNFSFREMSGMRIMVLFGAFFILTLITLFINETFSTYFPDPRSLYLTESVIQCLLVFLLPAIITARFASSEPAVWLSINRSGNLKSYIGVFLLYIIGMPAMNFIIEWNNDITFPVAFEPLELKLREWENAGKEITDIILSPQSFGQFLITISIVGILTGLSEEFFFRGALLKIFFQSKTGVFLSIWIVAFLFSFFHFQFFGFIPRLLLGALFGYLILWSKSLWVAVFAHILNNSIVVLGSQIGQSQTTVWNNPLINGENNFICGLSFIFIILFFIYFRRFFFYKDYQKIK